MLNKLRNLVFHNFYSVFEYVFIAFGHKVTRTYRNIEKEFKMSDLKKEIRIDPLVIIEIGANDGSTTEEFLRIFSNCKVYAFEPDQRAIQIFKKRFMGNGRVELLEVAVTEDINKNEIDFYPSHLNSFNNPEDSTWHYSGSYLVPKVHLDRHPTINFLGSTKVGRTTLDNWASTKNIELINLIWMDTQGAEFKILTGASQVLKKCLYIFMEYSIFELYSGQMTLKSMLKLLPGWRVVRLYPHDVLLVNTELYESIKSEKN